MRSTTQNCCLSLLYGFYLWTFVILTTCLHTGHGELSHASIHAHSRTRPGMAGSPGNHLSSFRSDTKPGHCHHTLPALTHDPAITQLLSYIARPVMSNQDAGSDVSPGLAINTQHLPATFRNTSTNPSPTVQTPPRVPTKYGTTSLTPPSTSRGKTSRASDSSHSHARTTSQSTNSHSHQVVQQYLGAKKNGMNLRETNVEDEEPVKFVLLAEFDIDAGATLAQQYPFPTGTDEQ